MKRSYLTVKHRETEALYYVCTSEDLDHYRSVGFDECWYYTCYTSLDPYKGDRLHFYGKDLYVVAYPSLDAETLVKPPEKTLTRLVEEKGGLNEDGTFKDSLKVKEPKRAEYYPDGKPNPLYFKYDVKLDAHRCYVRVLEDGYDRYRIGEVYEAVRYGRGLVLVSTEGYEDLNGLALWVKGLHHEGEADECELLTLEEGGRLFSANNEGIKINLGFNPSGDDTATVNVNFDDHYKQAKTDKLPEPIEVIEAVESRLISAGLDVSSACNIARGLKYILRSGFKEGEDVNKEVQKFYNYVNRARTGEWLGGK